jgi:hypothetical protein
MNAFAKPVDRNRNAMSAEASWRVLDKNAM